MKPPFMQRCRNASSKTWLGAVLAVCLLLAEAFAVGHQYDDAAHTNGQACAICVGVGTFSAGNVAAPVEFSPIVATAFIVIAAGVVFLSVVPTRRYARGPPAFPSCLES